uniref:Palladin-like n=1 Tax=Oryzias melastigma TaxID=30732 RepID=A0A3B3DS08_ORYME
MVPVSTLLLVLLQCLHDVSTVKGQLVVLECRLRGTPPLQVMWYREDKQILDSEDFRILRKKASSASVPEELCTLVITEAFPEDSGLFKCVALNSFGSVSCLATLEVFNDLEEQLEFEAMQQQQERISHRQEKVKDSSLETASSRQSCDDFPPELPNLMNLPPPEWPDSPLDDNSFPDYYQSLPVKPSSEEPHGYSEEEDVQSPNRQRSPEILLGVSTPSPPPPPSPPPEAQVKEKAPAAKLFTPSKLSFSSSQSGGNNMNLSDLPTFTPSAFPPSAFNYERPRHFIQSQPAFQAPSYDSVLRDAQENHSSPQNLNGAQLSHTDGSVKASQAQTLPKSTLQSQFQSLSLTQNQSATQNQSVSHSQIENQMVNHSQNQSVSHAQTQSVSHAQIENQSVSHAQTQSVSHSQNQSVSHSQNQSVSHSQNQSVSHSQTQNQSVGHSQIQNQVVSQSLIQNQANGTRKSSPSSSSLSSPTSTPAFSAAPPPPPPRSSSPTPINTSSLPRSTVRSTITLTPRVPSATGLGSATLPANQDAVSASAAYLCSVLPSNSSKLSPNSSFPHASISPSRSPLSPSSPLLPLKTSSSSSSLPQQLPPVSPSFPHSPLSPSSWSQHDTPPSRNRVTPAVVSLPASYKGTPNSIPKPILKKSIAPRPSSSRSTDEDIQGSKDALIQDLEKKLRSKEARRRHSQKLSYEERMARRLLGPENATYMFDQDNYQYSDSQTEQSDLLQPDSPEGRHTGGLWGRRHSGTDRRSNEGSAIQEKCYAPRFLQTPPDLTVEEGRFCRIDFKVGGLPTPDVSWYLDGKAIRPDDYHKMLVCEKGMHSFIIEIVTVHHAGVYECVARNRAGESRFTMRLDVLAQEVLRPPSFVQKMLNTRALEGDSVRFECKVDASPPPQLHWKKDKDMLRIDPSRMSLYQDGSGRQCLLIERVVKADAGWYTLSAINEAGMSTCNARLDVGTRTTPPVKTAPPGSKTLKLLSSVSIPALTVESPAQHTAPLYESKEL